MIDWLSRDEQVIYFGQNLALLTETLFITAEVLLKGQEILECPWLFPVSDCLHWKEPVLKRSNKTDCRVVMSCNNT